MVDFTINRSKEVGRATLIGETRLATEWMERSGIYTLVLGNRVISYVDDKSVAVLQEALATEGFSVIVKDI